MSVDAAVQSRCVPAAATSLPTHPTQSRCQDFHCLDAKNRRRAPKATLRGCHHATSERGATFSQSVELVETLTYKKDRQYIHGFHSSATLS